jgi:hypothetical protein
VIVAGAGVAALLSLPGLLVANGMKSKWLETPLFLSYPGLLAAIIFGPFTGQSVHSGNPIGFFVVIFVLNIAILLTALLFVLNLIERFTKWRKEQE